MADISQFVDKDYEEIDFEDLADCPVAALQGLSEDDAQALKQTFGIETIRELAENKFVRIAQAIATISSVSVLQGTHGGEVTLHDPSNPTKQGKRRTDTTGQEEPNFKDFLLTAPNFEVLEIYRSDEPAPSVELR